MRPGLILPRIQPNEAVQAEKIDAHIKAMAEFVNGGLTGQSLAPNAHLATSAFVENRSLYSMTTCRAAYDGSNRMVGVTLVASRLVGMSASVSTTTIDASYSNHDRTVTLYTGNGSGAAILAWTLPGASTQRITTNAGTLSVASGFVVPDMMIDIPANMALCFSLSLASGEANALAYINLTFATLHSG